MADSGDGDIVLTERQRIRKESSWGNLLEAAFTYCSGATIYLPYNAYLLFWTGDSLNTPEAQAATWSQWILVTIYYLAANAVAAVEGTKAKYTSKTFRFFADTFSSALPLGLVVLMVIFMFNNTYQPTVMHMKIAFAMSAVCLIELLSNSNLVQTAVRRVREGTMDR